MTRGVALLLVLSLTACGPADGAGQTDGESCIDNGDCSTGYCTTARLCSHSACDCPGETCDVAGETSSDCRSTWTCVPYSSIFDPAIEFFHGTPDANDGYCQPLCAAGCPAHYSCDGSGVTCAPDETWAHPVPTITWSGAAAGTITGRNQMSEVAVPDGSALTLLGSATSPLGGALRDLMWTTVSDAGDYMMSTGASVAITVPAGGYRRVELTATDAAGRSSLVTVIFTACVGPGGTCLYMGSGCCSGDCDGATNACR